MEQKYGIGTESGQLLWDIKRMLNDIEKFENPIEFEVEKLLKISNLSVDKNYAISTDTRNPLIIANLCSGKDILIDGNHRLFKAVQEKLKTIECYYLKPAEHIKYIENYNNELYNEIVSEF